MVEQQLVDYIKKAKEAGQTDEQTKSLLYKNGWAEAEVSDAFNALSQPKPEPQIQAQEKPQPIIQPQTQPKIQTQPEVQPQIQAQPQFQPKVEAKIEPQVQQQPQIQSQTFGQPEIKTQPQQAVSQPEIKPQYQPQFAQEQNNMPSMRHMSHAIIKLFMVLIILVVIGGAGYFIAGQYFNLPYSNIFNLFTPSPQTVINKMITNMPNVKSSHSIMNAEVDVTDSSNKTTQGKLLFSSNGESDITDINNPKGTGNFTVDLTMPNSNFSANVNIAVIGKTYYVKINSLTLPKMVSTPGFDLSQVQGKWLKIDQDSIKAISEAKGSSISMIDIPQIGNTDMVKKIQSLILAENMFTFDKQLNNEVISGQNTYHYSVIIKKEKLADLFNKLTESVLASQSQKNTTDNSALVVNMAQAAAKTVADAIGDVNMELWIGQKDYMLYQVKIDKAIDLNNILASFGANNQNSAPKVEVKLVEINSNFNKPITVQEPAGSQKIENVVLPLSKNQQIESGIKQIGTEAASIFSANNSYSLLCKNGYLAGSKNTTYGLVFITNVNSMIKQGAKNPVCFATQKDYCVSTQVKDGTYRCIGTSGVLGKVRCFSAKTVCK